MPFPYTLFLKFCQSFFWLFAALLYNGFPDFPVLNSRNYLARKYKLTFSVAIVFESSLSSSISTRLDLRAKKMLPSVGFHVEEKKQIKKYFSFGLLIVTDVFSNNAASIRFSWFYWSPKSYHARKLIFRVCRTGRTCKVITSTKTEKKIATST